jgi:dipeptidase E
MKKLFLASIMPLTIEKLIKFLPKPPQELKIAFIPTAADPYEDKWFIKEDRDEFVRKGFQIKDVDINGKNEQKLFKELGDVDIIFVGGGNTFYLLQKTRESGFDRVVKKLITKGIIYVGASAGANLACPTIEPIKPFDDPGKASELKTFEGLNLVDFIVLPHFDNKNKKICEKIIKEYGRKGRKVIPITDKQAIMVSGDNHRVI